MNYALNIPLANVRQDEIKRHVAARRIDDDWQPAPPGTLADRIG